MDPDYNESPLFKAIGAFIIIFCGLFALILVIPFAFGNDSIPRYMCSNPLVFLFRDIPIYAILGTFWARNRWRHHVKEKRKSFDMETQTARTPDTPKDNEGSSFEAPDPRDQVEMIVAWILTWPLGILWQLFRKPFIGLSKKASTGIYNSFNESI